MARKTVQNVIDSMTKEQKNVLYAIVGQVFKEARNNEEDNMKHDCTYLKGKEDGIDIFKDLIIRYIDRAGACNIEDLERLAKVAKEKDILGVSNEIEKDKEIALDIIKQELSNSSDFVYICKDGREIGTDVSMIADWFNEYTNKEAKCYG